MNVQAEIKVAVIDTGFCHNEISKLNGQTISNTIDMTNSVNLDCHKISPALKNTSQRFHGQHVLQRFLRSAGHDKNITVFPLIVFDSNGNQTEAAWFNAINFIKKEKIDIVVAASSLPTKKRISESLHGVWFVAAGRTERGMTKKDSLFPQLLAPMKNLLIIGDYFESKGNFAPLYDQSLLYQNQISYYFPSGEGPLKGTSRAVAVAAGLAVNLCYDFLKSQQGLNNCLKKKSKILQDKILKRDFPTF